MKKEPVDTTIKIEHAIKGETVIMLVIDKIGVKQTLNIILGQCLFYALSASQFPSCLLATAQDEESAEAAGALYYLKKNWKVVAKKGVKMLVKKSKEDLKKKEAHNENT